MSKLISAIFGICLAIGVMSAIKTLSLISPANPNSTEPALSVDQTLTGQPPITNKFRILDQEPLLNIAQLQINSADLLPYEPIVARILETQKNAPQKPNELIACKSRWDLIAQLAYNNFYAKLIGGELPPLSSVCLEFERDYFSHSLLSPFSAPCNFWLTSSSGTKTPPPRFS